MTMSPLLFSIFNGRGRAGGGVRAQRPVEIGSDKEFMIQHTSQTSAP